MRLRAIIALLLTTLVFTFFPRLNARSQGDIATVLVLSADGPVTTAMSQYLKRGIMVAEGRGVELIIFQLNTPGGSIALMQEMVEDIRNSRIPVVVYITPRGAIAGSAGTVITLAGHLAAMAPETAIGAASPVGSQGEDIGETMEAKEKQILKALVRSLAQNRDPEAIELAEQTIETARAVTSQEAFDIGLVDFIANDLSDLLGQIDGAVVDIAGKEQVIDSAHMMIEILKPSLIEQLLQILTNPNIVFILLTLGVQSILIELSNPGGWVAGFVGIVCLALAGYGLGILPVNWFGLIFLGTAFVLFILDIKAPTHGALTAAGVGSLIVGALVLFNSPSTPQFQQVSVSLVIISSIITGGIFALAMAFALRAQRTPVRMGPESLVGKSGVIKEDVPLYGRGTVQVGGERWSAVLGEGEEPLPSGSQVEVIEVSGIRLKVKKL